MINKSILRCLICVILVHNDNCRSSAYRDQTLLNISKSSFASSLTSSGKKIASQENVTPSDKSEHDKIENNGGFPPSAIHRRNSDTLYQLDYDDGVVTPSSSQLSECILSRSEFYLSWWVNEDGSLQLPASNRDGLSPGFADLSFKYHSNDMIFKHVADMTSDNPNDVIIFMSVANNELSNFPVEALDLVSISLQYLSLANNNFYLLFNGDDESFQSWSSFPLMQSLKELDLRNCSMTSLDYDLFDNFPNLEKLFLSHNSYKSITAKTFSNLSRLSHLDLSYNEIHPSFIPYSGADPFAFYLEGLMLDESVFAALPNLIFLDLSHTKLRQESVRALAALREKVEQISLCYTEIPLIVPRMFNNTNIKVIDLSGNPSLLPNLASSWFEGLEQKLEILIFQNSNIKNLSPLKNLKKLRMLDLANNNINKIQAAHFANYESLEILDLNNNHISNWYESVFEKNNRLKVINLRFNNINLLTTEMMSDFSKVDLLAIGANSFVCDCSLRDFIDRAKFNALKYECTRNKRTRRAFLENDQETFYNVLLREFYNYMKLLSESCRNIRQQKVEEETFAKAFHQSFIEEKDNICDNIEELEKLEILPFNFLLLDYTENDYHCVNGSDGSSSRKILFSELEQCQEREHRSTGSYSTGKDDSELEESPGDGEGFEKEVAQRPQRFTLLIIISAGVPLTLIGALWFWKKRDIRYFCAIFKNTLILSLYKDDKKALMMKNRRNKSSAADQYIYDVFVSYSDRDRQWVLDQLIPNLEKRSEITICLHERDFQVGVGILENIIHSMDQSRCLLLVISESFLKSNWCSFEMHLAQHRLIETRREQLILVLLQDIPKARRPRTLTFLMRTKTYIMWPMEDKAELRNVFWKRLKKAITLNNWEPEISLTVPKPRHSIV